MLLDSQGAPGSTDIFKSQTFMDGRNRALSSLSGLSRPLNTSVSDISIGLSGLAGRPKFEVMGDAEQWITDPRSPIKKFSALLFNLSGMRYKLLA